MQRYLFFVGIILLRCNVMNAAEGEPMPDPNTEPADPPSFATEASVPDQTDQTDQTDQFNQYTMQEQDDAWNQEDPEDVMNARSNFGFDQYARIKRSLPSTMASADDPLINISGENRTPAPSSGDFKLPNERGTPLVLQRKSSDEVKDIFNPKYLQAITAYPPGTLEVQTLDDFNDVYRYTERPDVVEVVPLRQQIYPNDVNIFYQSNPPFNINPAQSSLAKILPMSGQQNQNGYSFTPNEEKLNELLNKPYELLKLLYLKLVQPNQNQPSAAPGTDAWKVLLKLLYSKLAQPNQSQPSAVPGTNALKEYNYGSQPSPRPDVIDSVSWRQQIYPNDVNSLYQPDSPFVNPTQSSLPRYPPISGQEIGYNYGAYGKKPGRPQYIPYGRPNMLSHYGRPLIYERKVTWRPNDPHDPNEGFQNNPYTKKTFKMEHGPKNGNDRPLNAPSISNYISNLLHSWSKYLQGEEPRKTDINQLL